MVGSSLTVYTRVVFRFFLCSFPFLLTTGISKFPLLLVKGLISLLFVKMNSDDIQLLLIKACPMFVGSTSALVKLCGVFM